MQFCTSCMHDFGLRCCTTSVIYLSMRPFLHLFNQGMVLKYSEKSGQVEKMSKSKGNVVNPDEIVHKYGSDVLRMYMMFMGPPELDCEWQDSGLDGIKRFLNRLWLFLTAQGRIVTRDQERPKVNQAAALACCAGARSL